MTAFHTGAFGARFEEVDSRGTRSQFGRVGSLTLRFVPIRDPADFVGFPVHQPGFEVPDVAAVLRAAERHGGRVEDPPDWRRMAGRRTVVTAYLHFHHVETRGCKLMGAWGVGTFENDEASDWVYRLEESGDLELVRETLAAAADPSGYLEATSCAEALAAAEVVAALVGRPGPDLPEEVRGWVADHRLRVAPELRSLGVRAVDQVAGESELKELWADSDDGDAWRDRIEELRGRLAG